VPVQAETDYIFTNKFLYETKKAVYSGNSFVRKMRRFLLLSIAEQLDQFTSHSTSLVRKLGFRALFTFVEHFDSDLEVIPQAVRHEPK